MNATAFPTCRSSNSWTRETRSAFSERVIEAVPENFPDAFECREAA